MTLFSSIQCVQRGPSCGVLHFLSFLSLCFVLVLLLLQGVRTKLTAAEAAPAARLSKRLVTIQTDVELPPLRFPMSHLALLSPTNVSRAAVKAAFAELEFSQHERRLEQVWANMARVQQEATGQHSHHSLSDSC